MVCFFAISCTGIASDFMGSGLTIPGNKWWQTPKVVRQLSLTTEEQRRLDGLYIQHWRKMSTLKRTVERENFELEQILGKENFDDARCMERFNKLQDARKDLVTEQFKFLVEVRKVLGTDRFRQLKANFHKRWMKGRQRMLMIRKNHKNAE